MEKKRRGGRAAKVAIGCGGLGFGLCVLGMIGIALVTTPKPRPERTAAAQPAHGDLEGELFDVPGCEFADTESLAEALAESRRPYEELRGTGPIFIRGTVVSTEPDDGAVWVQVAMDGVPEHAVFMDAEAECIQQGVRHGVEVVAWGTLGGVRGYPELGKAKQALAHVVATAEWWDRTRKGEDERTE